MYIPKLAPHRLLPAVLILLLTACSVSAQTTREESYIAKGKVLRVLCLGDSITSGYSDGFGNYRRPLQAMLTWGGFTFRFVGSNTAQASSYQGTDVDQTFSPYQPNCEGYDGFRIDQISSDTPAVDPLGNSYPGLTHTMISDIPDVVLVMLGTNDVSQAYDPGGPGYAGGTGFAADAAGRLNELIDRLYHINTDLTVVISSIPPLTDQTKNSTAASYNALIPQIVQAHRQLGQHVLFADMGSAVKAADLSSDGIHPSTAGYDKIAGVWYSAMTGRTAPELRVVSVEFVGSGSAMAASESAGVVAAANWNDAVGTASNGINLLDNSGRSTGAWISWVGSGPYNNGLPDVPGNNRMMRGYLDNYGTSTITVSDLPAAYTKNGYDVYVYANGSTHDATRVYSFKIGNTAINVTDPPNSDTAGAYVLAANSAGNYVKFYNLTGSSFTLTGTAVSSTDQYLRVAINGIQIVAH